MESNVSELHDLIEFKELSTKAAFLYAECKRHSGNVIEAHAFAVGCPRHRPAFRGCVWEDNKPCVCRSSVAGHFPEYADSQTRAAMV
jgi:hypothetical protein